MTEMVSTGTGLKIEVARDELVAQARHRVAGGLDQRHCPGALGHPAQRRSRGDLGRRHGHGALAADDARRAGRGRRSGRDPGQAACRVARLLPESEVTLEYRPEEGTVQIVSGSYSSRLHVFNAEDFPRLPSVDAQLHAIDREALLQTVDRVAMSASRDESRPVLTGILVRFEAGKLVMVATDSYRLSVKETALGEAAPELEAIIPARALHRALTAQRQRRDDRPRGAREPRGLRDRLMRSFWLTTHRIDGQFPNYRQLLPETFEVELTLPKAELGDVVRRASVLALRNSPLRLRLAEGELTVSPGTQDVGEHKRRCRRPTPARSS